MFTLKCVRWAPDEPTEFFETPSFSKERIVTETGHVVIVISGEFNGHSDDLHVSDMDDDWHEIFVMNSQGVTIEKIKAESQVKAPTPSVDRRLALRRLEWVYSAPDSSNFCGWDGWLDTQIESVGYEFDGEVQTEGQELVNVYRQYFLPTDKDASPTRLEQILREACRDVGENVEFILLQALGEQ